MICSACAVDDSASPLSLPTGETHAHAAVRAQEWVWERIEVRDSFFPGLPFLPTTESIFSTSHLSPLLDRGREEALTTRDAKQTQ